MNKNYQKSFLSVKKVGFTLIELLVVVLIIGILAAVAVSQYEKAVEKSRATEAFVLLKAIGEANKAYYMANGVYATHIDELDIDIPGEDVVYNGWRRKETKNFQFGTYATDRVNSIALANRIPFGKVYFLFITYDKPGIFCGTYNSKGTEICRMLSKGEREDNYYIIR